MENADTVEASRAEASAGARPGSKLWWWFVAVCFLQLVAWTTWIIVAAQHQVETVPLVRVR